MVQFATPRRRTLTQPQETRAKPERNLYRKVTLKMRTKMPKLSCPAVFLLATCPAFFSKAAQLGSETFSAASVADPAAETACDSIAAALAASSDSMDAAIATFRAAREVAPITEEEYLALHIKRGMASVPVSYPAFVEPCYLHTAIAEAMADSAGSVSGLRALLCRLAQTYAQGTS
jgi:hypothetical protein